MADVVFWLFFGCLKWTWLGFFLMSFENRTGEVMVWARNHVPASFCACFWLLQCSEWYPSGEGCQCRASRNARRSREGNAGLFGQSGERQRLKGHDEPRLIGSKAPKKRFQKNIFQFQRIEKQWSISFSVPVQMSRRASTGSSKREWSQVVHKPFNRNFVDEKTGWIAWVVNPQFLQQSTFLCFQHYEHILFLALPPGFCRLRFILFLKWLYRL